MSEQNTFNSGSNLHGGAMMPHGGGAAARNVVQEVPPSALSTLAPDEMKVYLPKEAVDMSTLVSLGTPEALGGQVLSGQPEIFGRVDFQQGNLMGGLFMATTGLIRVTFPFTEHATILEGEVTLTDATGKTQTFKPGDSYIIRQGQVILWDVKGKHVIKSFFNYTER
jgi:uncharacterized cupin superfamily protein